MHLGNQRRLKLTFPNMHGQYPTLAIGRSNIFNDVQGLLLGKHARVGTTPLPWPTETDCGIAVGHRNEALQA